MGYQTPGTGAKNKQKDHPVQSSVQHAANTRKQLPAYPHIASLSGTAPGHMHLDQSNGEPHGSGDFRRDFPVVSDADFLCYCFLGSLDRFFNMNFRITKC